MNGRGPGRLLTPEGVRLRRLFDDYRGHPFPARDADDARLQEIALYATWLASLVQAALSHGGHMTPSHRRLLAARRAEQDTSIWRVAAELGDPVRAYVALLLAMENALAELPDVS
ncbi:MAG TPA: hypothetical protein VIA06_12855 [Candidatus Dormibacteraeota bacterium]|nr:hypothetical protein [Candidatus Dormibacteraeota bacterium]